MLASPKTNCGKTATLGWWDYNWHPRDRLSFTSTTVKFHTHIQSTPSRVEKGTYSTPSYALLCLLTSKCCDYQGEISCSIKPSLSIYLAPAFYVFEDHKLFASADCSSVHRDRSTSEPIFSLNLISLSLLIFLSIPLHCSCFYGSKHYLRWRYQVLVWAKWTISLPSRPNPYYLFASFPVICCWFECKPLGQDSRFWNFWLLPLSQLQSLSSTVGKFWSPLITRTFSGNHYQRSDEICSQPSGGGSLWYSGKPWTPAPPKPPRRKPAWNDPSTPQCK